MDQVNPPPCSEACANAVRDLSQMFLPRALVAGQAVPTASDLDLDRFSARGQRWHLAAVVAVLGGRTPGEMAALVEAASGPGVDLSRAAQACRDLAEAAGPGAAGIVLRGADQACCAFEIGPDVADWWREAARDLGNREIHRRLRAKRGQVPRL